MKQNKLTRGTQRRIRRQLKPALWNADKLAFISKYKELSILYGPNVDIVIKRSSYDNLRDDLQKLLILI